MLRKPSGRVRAPARNLSLFAIVLALGSLSGGGAAGQAQEPAAQNPSFFRYAWGPTPTRGGATRSARSPRPQALRTGATAVVLDVVIRDKQGRPVRDVQQGELTVLEDGAARDILSFRLVERTAAASGPGLPAAAPKTSGEVPDALRYPTLVTMVFDHLTQNSRTLARRAALQFVAREMPANQWVAVYTLEQRLRLAQTFTRDINELKIAIERATAAFAEGRDRLAGGRSLGTRPNERPTQPWPWSPPAGRTPKARRTSVHRSRRHAWRK